MEGTGEPGQKARACPKTPAVECLHRPYNIPLYQGSCTPGKVLPSEAHPRCTPTAPDAVGALGRRKEEAVPLVTYSPEKATLLGDSVRPAPHVSAGSS